VEAARSLSWKGIDSSIYSNPKHAVFVAVSDSSSITGWIHVLPRLLLIWRPIAEIGGIVVDEKERRKGIGRALISRAEKWAKENGYEGIIVRSDSRRQESHKFYPAISCWENLDMILWFILPFSKICIIKKSGCRGNNWIPALFNN
jgi:GNAT superfamily N-acetyltransferase